MQEDARAVDSSIKEMDESLTYLNKEAEELRGTVEGKDKQIEYLHTQHLYLESYSRRENLKFFGISESEAAGLTCRSQVTGQVTGHRPQVRSQVRSQVTHKNNRTLDTTVLD